MTSNKKKDWVNYYPHVYENLSKTYHNARFGAKWGQYDLFESEMLINEIFSKTNQKLEGMRVLDVGCGTGKMSIPIAKKGANVTCLDASPGMLQQCYKRAVENKTQSRIHLTEASADKIPYGLGVFDLVISSRFLHLFPVSLYATFINEMLRVVKTNGYVIIEIKNKYYGFALFLFREFMKSRENKNPSSSMSRKEIYKLQDSIASGCIVMIETCQLPKAHLLATPGKPAMIARILSRTLLRSIAGFHFVVIRKI